GWNCGAASSRSHQFDSERRIAMTAGTLIPVASQAFWSSGAAVASVSALCALLVGLTVASLLSRGSSRGRVRNRVREFLSPLSTSADDGRASGQRRSRLLVRAAHGLESGRWWAEFDEKLKMARIERSAIEVAYLTA